MRIYTCAKDTESKEYAMENYSVLMSVYGGEKADFFRLSADSIFGQTIPTDDFVLMCDGPLTDELNTVIEELLRDHGDVLRVIRLEENRGLGEALNIGIEACKNELIARMDSDDFALPNRCELQLLKFQAHPELSIVGGAIDEFEGTPANIVSHKSMPETHDEILRYARTRNPFNHPTVMYRRSAVLKAGRYPNRMLHEDYALWANMLLAGARACNLPDTLCYMRVDSGLYDRRGGWAYLKMAIRLRWHLYRSGLYTFWSFLYVVLGLSVVCMIPVSARKAIYRLFLRQDANDT